MPPKSARSSSRNKSPKKSTKAKALKDPLPQEHHEDDAHDSDATPHTNHTDRDAKIDKAKTVDDDSKHNQHSAQAKLNKSLDPDSYQSRLQQLQSQAAAKKASLLSKASAFKKRQLLKKLGNLPLLAKLKQPPLPALRRLILKMMLNTKRMMRMMLRTQTNLLPILHLAQRIIIHLYVRNTPTCLSPNASMSRPSRGPNAPTVA